MQVVNRICDMVYLSLLWVVCSIPLVTIGLSTAALYHTHVNVFEEGEGNITKTFFRSFKQSWKQALPLGAIFVLLSAFCLFVMLGTSIGEEVYLTGFVVSFVLLLQLVLFQIYLYPLIGHFYLTVPQLLRMAFQIICMHPIKSLLLVIFYIIVVTAVIFYPPLAMIVPAGYVWIASSVYTPLFFRYIRVSKGESSEETLTLPDDTQN